MKVFRCAIYTRKSSEEGLEQEFNSLHAQREACEAYIHSQKHEGWQLIKTAYDDGGISGGTMERPALKQLLSDIRDNRVDIIVVYKVDRLTRSLHDFAKMVDLFDKHHVSFVSVTQQFNTTSSMGRLTLNVLLSFAQFEREVTGERIRDKIAASKAKGMWMGGYVPLGYDLKERKIIINFEEGETVKYIFHQYLKLQCVRLLKEHLDNKGIRTKIRTAEDGTKKSGGCPLSRGMLYKMLSNPIYIGKIRHKTVVHPGQHEAIIEQSLWDAVQEQLKSNVPARQLGSRQVTSSFLDRKLFDDNGERMVPSHANKKGRRYRYYVSYGLKSGVAAQNLKGWRVPAQEMEQAVIQAVKGMLSDRTAISISLIDGGAAAQQLPGMLHMISEACKDDNSLALLIERVELRQDGMTIRIALGGLLSNENHNPILIIRDISMQMKRRGVEVRLVIGNFTTMKTDATLQKTIARARIWVDDLISGKEKSVGTIAARNNVSAIYVSGLLPVAFLAPEIVQAVVDGRQPTDLTSDALVKKIKLPLVWKDQEPLVRLGA